MANLDERNPGSKFKRDEAPYAGGPHSPVEFFGPSSETPAPPMPSQRRRNVDGVKERRRVCYSTSAGRRSRKDRELEGNDHTHGRLL